MITFVASAGDKIRHIRANRKPKLTQNELAEILGVTRNQLANIESNRTEPPKKVIDKLSRMWDVSKEWFWDDGEVEPPSIPTMPPGNLPFVSLDLGTNQSAATYRIPENNLMVKVQKPRAGGYKFTPQPGMGRRKFPVIGTAGASAFPLETSSDPDDYVEFSDDLFHPERFAIRIKGISMEPEIPNGAFVLIHPTNDPPYGLMTVAKNDQSEYVVKVRRKIDGQDFLMPLNPDYEPIKPGEGWEMVGFVVGIREEWGHRKYRESGDNDGIRPRQNLHIFDELHKKV